VCSVVSNGAAEEGFAALERCGDREMCERRLVEMASADTVAQASGLELSLELVSSWRHNEILRSVRRYRIGYHRVFVLGRHTDCQYKVCFIKVSKKRERDPEENWQFQNRVLRALEDPARRTLELPSSA
jgi:hypothetical protein